jgi:hypothetical protein
VIASHIENECIARDATLEKYLAIVQSLENYFKGFTVEYVESTKNNKADELAKAPTRKTILPPDVFFQIIEDPSVKKIEPEPRIVNII